MFLFLREDVMYAYTGIDNMACIRSGKLAMEFLQNILPKPSTDI